jgi:hypothetical protein
VPTATPVAPSPDGELVIARLEPLRPMPVHQVQAAMQEYQAGLAALLDDTDWQVFMDRNRGERRFVKRSGWRKIGTWFGLDLLIKDESIVIDRDEQGNPLRTRLTARVIAPNGRKGEDVGACSITERRFSKPEHDLLATAATRALNRATANLVGMGEVTAEEILTEVEPLLPEWAQVAPDTAVATMLGKLRELVGDERAGLLTRAVGERYDGVPNVVTGLVNALHSMLTATPPEPTPTDDPASAPSGE